MDISLLIAIAGVLISIAMAALMAIYPNLRLLWWAVISVCVGGTAACVALYYLHRMKDGLEVKTYQSCLIWSCGLMAFLISILVMLYFDPSAYRKDEDVVAAAIPTRLRLQFFGDHRIPTEISNNNVAVWFTYYTSSITLTPKDKDGKPLPGGFEVPPNWVIFLALDKPATYHQVLIDFSNPEKMPITDIQVSNTRVIAISTRGTMPAGVLDIHVAQ